MKASEALRFLDEWRPLRESGFPRDQHCLATPKHIGYPGDDKKSGNTDGIWLPSCDPYEGAYVCAICLDRLTGMTKEEAMAELQAEG